MWINDIKAGLVNLAGASSKRHWELKVCGTMRIILPCSVCLVQFLDPRKNLLSLFFHFLVNKSVCLVSLKWPAWIKPSNASTACLGVGSGESVVDSWGTGKTNLGGRVSDLTHSYTLSNNVCCWEMQPSTKVHTNAPLFISLTTTHKAQTHIHNQPQTAIKSLLSYCKKICKCDGHYLTFPNTSSPYVFFLSCWTQEEGEQQDS